jgi:hypothetical protein
MTQKAILFISLLFSLKQATCQISYKQAEWQQTVNYKIQVTLDDKNHILNGFIQMEYINNSPDELKEIYIHLWPNAYKNNKTDFAKQKAEGSKSDFLFAKEEDRGYIDSLNIYIDNATVQTYFVDDARFIYPKYLGAEDIIVIQLPKSLKSGSSMIITTPFRVKIPGSFSRMGHVKNAYQITQWFPKPAVYDINGWNPMPYLDQGEFYSEFGKFEVSITVPKNYVLAATGVLQNQSEKDFILDRINNPIDPEKEIVTSDQWKTVTYIQDSIHDFAWFAAKNFNIEKSKATLETGKVVETFVFSPSKKINHAKYINNALTYYSSHVGEYPYNFCTVVEGSLKAGGGMEYPMITVCDFLSEEVIVHEVGHNWFYGILGNNERVYPWMDESINSFFEHETVEANKEVKKDDKVIKKKTLRSLSSSDGILEALALQAMRMGTDQAPGGTSEDFTDINYGTMVYGKGASLFKHLKGYLGDDVFYKCFRAYFDLWKFKHPLPDDMKEVFEKTSGKQLNWFFTDLIFTTRTLDYGIKNVEMQNGQYTITLTNKGDVAAPLPLDLIDEQNHIVRTIWVEGFRDEKTITLENGDSFSVVRIDALEITSELFRQNNTYNINWKPHKIEPLHIKLGTSAEDAAYNKLNFLPAVGYNIYNKFMIGGIVHNIGFPSKRTEFLIAPLYSFETKDLNGYAQIYKRYIYKNKKVRSLESGINLARFGFNNFGVGSYNKFNPYLTFRFNNDRSRGTNDHELTIGYVNLSFKDRRGIRLMVLEKWNYWNDQNFVRAEYSFKQKKAIRPSSALATLEYGNYNFTYDSKGNNFLKLYGSYQKFINYNKPKKGLTVRLFAGTMIKQADSSGNGSFDFNVGSYNGKFDYTFEHSLMGRATQNGLFQNQILPDQSYQKFVGAFGTASKYLVSLNLRSTLPGKLPIQLYADAVTFNSIDQLIYIDKKGEKFTEPFFYNAGICILLPKDIFEIYIPLVQSKVITGIQNDYQRIDKFHERIVFVLNLNKLDPRQLIKTVNLF